MANKLRPLNEATFFCECCLGCYFLLDATAKLRLSFPVVFPSVEVRRGSYLGHAVIKSTRFQKGATHVLSADQDFLNVQVCSTITFNMWSDMVVYNYLHPMEGCNGDECVSIVDHETKISVVWNVKGLAI